MVFPLMFLCWLKKKTEWLYMYKHFSKDQNHKFLNYCRINDVKWECKRHTIRRISKNGCDSFWMHSDGTKKNGWEKWQNTCRYECSIWLLKGFFFILLILYKHTLTSTDYFFAHRKLTNADFIRYACHSVRVSNYRCAQLVYLFDCMRSTTFLILLEYNIFAIAICRIIRFLFLKSGTRNGTKIFISKWQNEIQKKQPCYVNAVVAIKSKSPNFAKKSTFYDIKSSLMHTKTIALLSRW